MLASAEPLRNGNDTTTYVHQGKPVNNDDITDTTEDVSLISDDDDIGYKDMDDHAEEHKDDDEYRPADPEDNDEGI